METAQQENTQEVLQDNLLEGNYVQPTSPVADTPRVVQLVQPKEAEDEIAKLERQYREIIERENKLNGRIN